MALVVITDVATYEGRHRDKSPGGRSRGAGRAFVAILGVGLMYRGSHRDDSPEAHERDRAARDLELKVGAR